MLEVLRNGKFSFKYNADKLTKGLRAQSKASRNSYNMSDISGLIGYEDGLTTIPIGTTAYDATYSPAFPYPQIFVLSRLTLFLTATKICEMNHATKALSLKLTVTAADTWSVVDFFGAIFLTNGRYSVWRDANTGGYTLTGNTTKYPPSNALCNYNGQVIAGGITK